MDDYRIGWRIFCRGGYLHHCANDEQREGFAAAWREAEMVAASWEEWD